MARTLLSDPQLIVLDESLGALDPGTRQHAVEGVLGQQAAVLLITQ